jgi:YegS/Rv2252/BmrU family lipid kinase
MPSKAAPRAASAAARTHDYSRRFLPVQAVKRLHFFLAEAATIWLYCTLRMRIIANPRAGRGRSARELSRLRDLLKRKNVQYSLVETEYPGHATELARDFAAGNAAPIVAMGGDGTISEVLNGTLYSSVELGLISVGTGNDTARSLGLPYNDIPAALDVILSGAPRSIDVGWAEDRSFISTLGVGFAATLAGEANRLRWLKGPAAFFGSLCKTLAQLEPIPLVLTLDGQSIEMNCTCVLIQNTPYCGGGLLLAPDAKLDDGLFDVVIVSDIGRWDLLLHFPLAYRGRHLNHKHFSICKCRQIRVQSFFPVRRVCDGDIHGESPVHATVLPRAAMVIAPPTRRRGGGPESEEDL